MPLKIKSSVGLMLIAFTLISAQSYARSSDPVIPIKLDKSVLSKTGTLDEKSAVEVLSVAYDQGALTRGDNKFPSPKCLRAKDISSQGGLKTLALFAIFTNQKCLGITSDNGNDKIAYILKEMQDNQEPTNLHIVKQNPQLRKLDMALKKEEGLPSISFHHELISYQDKKGKTRALAILDVAPGKELRSLVESLADLRDSKKSNKEDFNKQAKNLKNAFYHVGRALGKMQNRFMEPVGKIFGVTFAHGDLHDRNVFFDGSKVTFIDNESFIHSLKEKKPVWVDLFRLLNPVFNPKPEKHHPKQFKPQEWVEWSVTPLLQGYVDGYPNDKRKQVKTALKDMLLSSSEATDKILEQYGKKHLQEVRDVYLEPALSAVK